MSIKGLEAESPGGDSREVQGARGGVLSQLYLWKSLPPGERLSTLNSVPGKGRDLVGPSQEPPDRSAALASPFPSPTCSALSPTPSLPKPLRTGLSAPCNRRPPRRCTQPPLVPGAENQACLPSAPWPPILCDRSAGLPCGTPSHGPPAPTTHSHPWRPLGPCSQQEAERREPERVTVPWENPGPCPRVHLAGRQPSAMIGHR